MTAPERTAAAEARARLVSALRRAADEIEDIAADTHVAGGLAGIPAGVVVAGHVCAVLEQLAELVECRPERRRRELAHLQDHARDLRSMVDHAIHELDQGARR